MKRLALFLPLLLFLVSCTSSCVSEGEEVEPIENWFTLAETAMTNWLRPRIDSGGLKHLLDDPVTDELAGWKTAETLDELVAWFKGVYGDTPLWDLQVMIDDIKATELYQKDGPSDAALLGAIRSGISRFLSL